MAIEAGFPMTLTIDIGGVGKDLSEGITSLDYSTPRGVQDVTGVDKPAVHRILLLADCSGTLNSSFNDEADHTHDAFKTIPSSAEVSRTFILTISAKTLTSEVWFTDYPLARGADGSLTSAVPFVLANGVAPVWA